MSRHDGVRIAYQVVGHGPVDLLVVPGFISHLDLSWAMPSVTAMFRRLASFSRLIVYDKAGTGISGPIGHVPTLEERMDEVHAVLDAAGSERAALLGLSEGGPHERPVRRHLPRAHARPGPLRGVSLRDATTSAPGLTCASPPSG